ncbi:MAG: UbiA family prenyltransferase [Euryarchaeota archaeon]|nr:UbiA family prenyltransferase [Euryarchaeota archaeon]
MNFDKIKEYAKVIRLKSMGISTIAVFGALSVKGSLEIWHFLVLFVIGIFFNILGFVLNDIVDLDLDKRSIELSERPLVKGTVTKFEAKMTSLMCYIFIFGLGLFFFRDILPISILVLSVVFGSLYDVWGKRFLGSDFVLSGSIAFFCLFGALTVSHEISAFTIIIVIIIFYHVLFFNIIEGGLKDADNDRKSGVKTTAVYSGVEAGARMHIPKIFIIFAIVIESISTFFVFLPFVIIPAVYNFKFWYIQIIILIMFIFLIFLSIIKMFNISYFDRRKVRNIITFQEIKRYIITAVLLMSFAGILWSAVLIVIPIVWHLLFSFIMFHKPFSPSTML